MKLYFKYRYRSPLVKHYHQEELKRLEKKLTYIKHRKKSMFPSDKYNILPILTPRYHLTINRQQEIKFYNDRLSSRIAYTKMKESEYFKKILREKERISTMEMKEKHEIYSQKVRMIYSSSVANILHCNLNESSVKYDKRLCKSRTRNHTQRTHNVEKKVSYVL